MTKKSLVAFDLDKFREKIAVWEEKGVKHNSTSEKKITEIKRILQRHQSEIQLDDLKKLIKIICKLSIFKFL